MKKMVKKTIAIVLASIMALSLVACGDSSNSNNEPAPTTTSSGGESSNGGAYQVTSPVELTFATQDVGTTAYVYASTMANMFSDAFPAGSVIDVTTTSPGGVGAPVILENGECELIISNSVPSKWAVESGILGTPPAENVRGVVGGLDLAFINVLFTQEFVDKTGITTIEELVEQQYPVRVAIKSAGAFGELACSKVFEVLGASYADIGSWGGSVTQTGSDAIVSLLKDGKADLTIDHLAPGQSATTELCMTTKMYFPQLSDETLDKLVAEGFEPITVAAETWSGQAEEIRSVGSPQVILASADLDDATVYLLTKTLCEGRDTLVTASAALSAFDPETAWEPLKVGAPLHPGAEAYYREMGYMN